MADKSFGLRQLNLVGVGTPSIESSTDLVINTNGSERFRVDSSGRISVGTADTTGTQLLKVNGTTAGSLNGGVISLTQGRTAPPNGSTHGVLNFGSETRPDGGAQIVGFADGAWTDGSDHNSGMYFATTADGSTSPTERMRINAAGYLDCHQGAGAAFGDDAHAFRHDTTADTYVAKFIHETTSVPKGLYIQYRNASPNGSGSPFIICVDNNGSTFARINSNGGFSNYQANDNNLCDEREKKNIVDLDSTWDCLKQWELKKFHYNGDADTDDKRYGVIAQQVAQHCPEVITDWVKQEASDAVLDEDGNELQPAREEIVRMGVKEQQMYWMAIRALQEAQNRIETLETEKAEILARLDAAGI